MKAKTVIQTLNEAANEKDIQRIKDIFTKSGKDDDKVIKLGQSMAKLITNVEKARGRADAVDQLIGKDNELYDIFNKRALELEGNTPGASKISPKPIDNKQPPLPTSNPKLKAEDMPKDIFKGYRRNIVSGGYIFLPTYSAMTLWSWEITGQLSDGAWENSKPDDHWVFWSNLKPRWGVPEVQSIGYPRKTGYNLAGLIEYVGDRMVKYGRFGKAVGEDILNIGGEVRSIVEEFPKDGPFDLKEFKENMISKKDWRSKEYYWEGLEQKHVDAYYAMKYDEKDMRKDLSNIKAAMKNIKSIW